MNIFVFVCFGTPCIFPENINGSYMDLLRILSCLYALLPVIEKCCKARFKSMSAIPTRGYIYLLSYGFEQLLWYITASLEQKHIKKENNANRTHGYTQTKDVLVLHLLQCAWLRTPSMHGILERCLDRNNFSSHCIRICIGRDLLTFIVSCLRFHAQYGIFIVLFLS
jgi:hypothetical protein